MDHPRKIAYLLIQIVAIATMLLMCSPNKTYADKNHPFYQDIKEAYKDSKLIYDTSIEGVLYRKLPQPQDLREEMGLSDEFPKPTSPEEVQVMSQTGKVFHRQFFKKVKGGKPDIILK